MQPRSTLKRTLVSAIAATSLALAAGPLAAQAQAPAAGYPTKPITLVIPSAAGGGLDVAMRLLAKRLSEELGVPVVSENRPSVNLLVGTRHVASAAPDGYTLLAMSNTFIGATVFADAPGYDAFRDFVAISPTAHGANLLLVSAESGIGSARELVERAKKAGEQKLTYGSAGIGSSPHVAAVQFARSTGTEFIDVAYKGTAPALVDLIGGRITFLFDSVAASLPHIKSGRVRALGATTAKRSSVVPDIPTIAEVLNVPDFDLPLFYGIAAPAKTPPQVVAVLNQALAKVAADPGVREQYAAMGFETRSSSPEEFTRFLQQQHEKLRSLKN
jgi:tripartite-type tricarboxylate transporter receptor subunit TctC